MYDYLTQREELFTDDGQRMFLQIRDHVNKILTQSGAIDIDHAIRAASGDSWACIACIDRMVELRELREIKQPGSVAGQHRIFVKQ